MYGLEGNDTLDGGKGRDYLEGGQHEYALAAYSQININLHIVDWKKKAGMDHIETGDE